MLARWAFALPLLLLSTLAAPHLLAGVPETGLWVGRAAATAVSREDGPSHPAVQAFSFPFILHVDDAGTTRMLKTAVIVRVPPDGSGVLDPVPTVFAGGPNLLSHLQEIPQTHIANALRYATAAYDFDGSSLPINGQVQPGKTLSVKIVLPATSNANPFRHRFHPDHDNKDDEGRPFSDDREVYRIERTMSFALRPNGSIDDGSMTGEFEELITGLHVLPITVTGNFYINRVSEAGALVE